MASYKTLIRLNKNQFFHSKMSIKMIDIFNLHHTLSDQFTVVHECVVHSAQVAIRGY